MNQCVIIMRANTKLVTSAIVNSYNLEEGKLNITCSSKDGRNLVSANEHGQLLEQGYIDEPYNKKDYQINIYLKINDETYKIYDAKIKSIFINDTCELTFGFNSYNKLETVQIY